VQRFVLHLSITTQNRSSTSSRAQPQPAYHQCGCNGAHWHPFTPESYHQISIDATGRLHRILPAIALSSRHHFGRCAVMRRIDLTCLILSPMMVGFAMTYAGTVAAVLVILAWNLAAWAPECMLLTYSEAQVPRLR